MPDLKRIIFEAVKDDLAEIEAALEENLTPHLDIVRQTASHILFSGGKRLRPLLMVLSARLCGYSGQADTSLSNIFEYLHAATLLHDDLVDDASLRRGKPVAHSVWGNSIAVLVGDFLLARSLSVGARTGRMEVIRVIANITEEMSQGEIHQLMRKGNLDLSEAEYTEIIRRKTAVLIQGACRVGALIADADAKTAEALSAYGFNLGMAFQMADDLLDYLADTASLGKAVGADLREGKLTLPLIRALETASPEIRGRMKAIIGNPAFSPRDFEELTDMLTTCGGISYTKEKAATYVANAKAAISDFEDSDTRTTLLNIADYVLERKV